MLQCRSADENAGCQHDYLRNAEYQVETEPSNVNVMTQTDLSKRAPKRHPQVPEEYDVKAPYSGISHF